MLYFNRPKPIRSVNHEVHLRARMGPPEGKGLLPPAIGDPSPEVLGDQPLQGEAFGLLRLIQWAGWPEGSENPRVEKVEFRVAGKPPLGPFGEYRQGEGKQQILQDGKITLHRLAFDTTVTSNVANVEDG